MPVLDRKRMSLDFVKLNTRENLNFKKKESYSGNLRVKNERCMRWRGKQCLSVKNFRRNWKMQKMRLTTLLQRLPKLRLRISHWDSETTRERGSRSLKKKLSHSRFSSNRLLFALLRRPIWNHSLAKNSSLKKRQLSYKERSSNSTSCSEAIKRKMRNKSSRIRA